MSHVSSVCVCSVCEYFSVCVCVFLCESVCTHPQECVMVWSVLQQTLDKVVSYVMLLAASQERRGWGGEGGGEAGRGGGGREVRPQRLFLHSQDFLHMMRRPWIEASRLWGGKKTNTEGSKSWEENQTPGEDCLCLCVFTLKSQMVIAPSMPVVQNLRQSLLSPS